MSAATSFEPAEAPAPVEIQIAASPVWFPMVRAVTDHLALLVNLGADATVDLRLAVDEACGMLTSMAPATRTLTCTTHIRPDEIDVEINTTTPAAGHATAPANPFAWRLLQTVTDRLTLNQPRTNGNRPRPLGIRLSKRIAPPSVG
jgi:serine/threonine-protein kinase RsbW